MRTIRSATGRRSADTPREFSNGAPCRHPSARRKARTIFAQHLLTKAAERLRRGDYYYRRLGVHLSWVGDLGGWWDETDFHETRDTGFLLARLEEIWKRVLRYNPLSVGVVLLDLVPADHHQPDLFMADNARRQKLSPLIDRINDRYGRCSIGFGLFPSDVRAFKGRSGRGHGLLQQNGLGLAVLVAVQGGRVDIHRAAEQRQRGVQLLVGHICGVDERRVIAARLIKHAERFQVPADRIAPRQKIILDPVLQISATRVRQYPVEHHFAAEHLDRDELDQDLLPGGGPPDLGFEALLDRVGELAGISPQIEVGQ